MSGNFGLFLPVLLTVVSLCPVIYAQDCAPPAITANSKIYNIFSPEQEMVLGDLNYQRMSGDLRFLRDREIEAYLNALGQKLVKHLPPSGLTFQFHIVDIPEANAFNTPGGYVFVAN
jgi:Putative Zn-dependent protease, contains TPR repeats